MDLYHYGRKYIFEYNQNIQSSKAKANVTSDTYEGIFTFWYDEEKGDQKDRNRNMFPQRRQDESFSPCIHL